MKDKTIKLQYSISIPTDNGDVQCSELILGRFKAKHLKLLPKDFGIEGGEILPYEIIPLIAGLANIPVSSADEIDIKDLGKIAGKLESFLAESLPESGGELFGQ